MAKKKTHTLDKTQDETTAPVSHLTSASELLDSESPLGKASRKKHERVKLEDGLESVPYDQRAQVRAIQGLAEVEKLSLDKHTEKLRYKVAYNAHKLADDLSIALSSKAKKDVNYVKGLVWSLGVLFDKLSGGQSDAVSVRIPAKLLENVKAVIAVQLERKANKIIDVTPSPLDSESSATSVNTTG